MFRNNCNHFSTGFAHLSKFLPIDMSLAFDQLCMLYVIVLWTSCFLPGSVTLDHCRTVFCLFPEELIEHPVLAQRLDPLLALAALVAAASARRKGGGGA